MTSEQFTYWLQGYAELTATAPSAEQWQSIREHLALVFNKVTPPVRTVEWTPLPIRPTPTIAPNPQWQTTCVSVPDTSARVTC